MEAQSWNASNEKAIILGDGRLHNNHYLQRYSRSRETANLHRVQGSVPALGQYAPFMVMGDFKEYYQANGVWP